MAGYSDKRLPVYLRHRRGCWEMKQPWSKIPAARNYRPIPNWPGAEEFHRQIERAGYRVEVEANTTLR